MELGRWPSICSVIVPLLLVLALSIVASNADTISDDDLVERIKSNEFVVALFGELTQEISSNLRKLSTRQREFSTPKKLRMISVHFQFATKNSEKELPRLR